MSTALLPLDLGPLGDVEPHISPISNTSLDYKFGLGLILHGLWLVGAEKLENALSNPDLASNKA